MRFSSIPSNLDVLDEIHYYKRSQAILWSSYGNSSERARDRKKAQPARRGYHSPQEYDRMRNTNLREFTDFCEQVAGKAKKKGLTSKELMVNYSPIRMAAIWRDKGLLSTRMY